MSGGAGAAAGDVELRRMHRRVLLAAAVVLLAVAPGAQAEKLPVDEGLQVTLEPGTTRMKVGQVVEFRMLWRDDDATTVETSLEAEANYGTAMAGDGVCDTPLQRQAQSGEAAVRAVFRKPGRYVVRGVVATWACHGSVTGTGDERVAVSRTITVVR